jgi:HPt (histidine-containing phosphotransfer) domain-containing protein
VSFDPQITPEMKARYITRRREDVAKLLEAQEAGDFSVLRGVAHQIKGNAATFSFQDLEQHAIALEEAADAANAEACALQIGNIQRWVESQTPA